MDWYGMKPSEFEELAGTHGTPFFLYEADVVIRRIRELRDALQGYASIYYAVKANPNLELLRAVSQVADGVDISSAGELDQVLLAGFEAANISFAGPAKTATELESAIRAGVGCISVESPREIEECARIARQLGKRAQVMLRVNPIECNRAYGLKMGGRPIQFGIDEEELPQTEGLLNNHLRYLDFLGVHVYIGSQCFDAAGIEDGTRETLRIARELEVRTGLKCQKINLGGGFGISHSAGGRRLEIPDIASRVVPLLHEFNETHTGSCALIFELGRYLTAEAGIYVTRVISSKISRGTAFFTCDGGLNHHLAAAGTFGAALRSNFELCNLSHPDEVPMVCNIAGPSCNPTDLLGVDTSLPCPRPSDLLGVLRSGSYGFTASPLLFLGHPTPTELVRQDGMVVASRRPRHISGFN